MVGTASTPSTTTAWPSVGAPRLTAKAPPLLTSSRPPTADWANTKPSTVPRARGSHAHLPGPSDVLALTLPASLLCRFPPSNDGGDKLQRIQPWKRLRLRPAVSGGERPTSPQLVEGPPPRSGAP